MSFHAGTWQKNAGAAAKYFADLTTELVSGLEPGHWGFGAKALGLDGPVSLRDFRALAYGKDPRTGQNITPRQKQNRRAVLECVASCPKSFSVAAIVGRDERLVELFNKSVAETMVEAGRWAAVRGRDEAKPAQDLIYAHFTHDVSRAQDPDLHAHLPVFNMAQDRAGRWLALETVELFARQRLISAVLNTKLAAGARALGYDVERSKNGFELSAVPQHVRDQFSKGAKKIDQATLKLTGKTKAHGGVRSVLAWKTRPDKTHIDEQQLHGRWRAEIGGDYDKIVEAVVAARSKKVEPELRPNPYEAVHDAIIRLTERKSVVRDHDVETAVLNEAAGRLSLVEVRLAMARPAQGVIVGTPDRFGSRKITTEVALATERLVVKAARSRVGIYKPILQPKDRRAVLERIPERHRKGMAKLISSRDGVLILTAEEEIRQIATEIGQKVGAVLLNADKLSMAELSRVLDGKQPVVILANPSKNSSGAVRLLTRQTACCHARCAALAEAPEWRDIRALAQNRRASAVLSLMEQSDRVRPECEAVSWALENDAVLIAPNWAEAERLTQQIRLAAKLGKEAKKFKVIQQVPMDSREKRKAQNYRAGMELRNIRGLGLAVKIAKIVQQRGNELELETGAGPNIVIHLSHVKTHATWTVHEGKEIEVRSGEKLLLKTGEKVTVEAFSENDEPITDAGFVVKMDSSVRHGWVVAETAPLKSKCVAVVGAKSRIGLCRALERSQNGARLFTDDIADLRERLFRSKKVTPASVRGEAPYQREAFKQQQWLSHCAPTWVPAREDPSERAAIAIPGQRNDKVIQNQALNHEQA
jgi:conjugative relaxase-like TrwC/TraI family protein